MGPATGAVLSEAGVDAEAVRRKAVSYRMLVDAGVNPGVAARIRREHSLAWSFESEGEDLRRRSAQVRGLGDAERAWVAASSGDWQAGERPTDPPRGEGGDESGDETDDGERAWVAASGDTASSTKTDGSGDPVAAESAWRERSRPTPVGSLDVVSPEEAADLAEAGITSVRALALADPAEVADALDRDADRVAELRDAAAARAD
ncbi:DUF7409 domain-containing protein [Halobaculum limi]|uniref:DUF7409 domain-containing protein n=1 Tax=Halobaculum limi TaxID=3031916 RepID=UPI002404AB89|nr:hypothetical protein [Halobaculum sp. YSMS11]